jgi:hypothetical protein
MRALDSNSKKQSNSTVSPVPKPAKTGGVGIQGSRPHDVLRTRDSLTATQPGDKHEREADRAADLAMNNRSIASMSSDEQSSSHSTQSAPRSGAPLDTGTRTQMETRFGHDFSQVRVHTDDKAAASARDVNARAYTVGSDIVFGKGQYHPSATSSQRLIAHELAHVVQQRHTGQPAVARQLDYEETGRNITRPNLEDSFKAGYWYQKVAESYDFHWGSGTSRLTTNPEESDAMFSVLWAKQPPTGFTTKTVVNVEIPARNSTPIGKPVLYRYTFEPKDPTIATSLPSVMVDFIGAGMTTAITPAKPPGNYSSSISSYSMNDFPTAFADYFGAFPEEEKYLFRWVEKEAPTKFSQLLKVRTSSTKKKVTTTRETSFFVEGEKDTKGKVLSLDIRFLGTYSPEVQRVPADYRSKDYADVLVERAQTTPDEIGGDTLGKVNLPTGISAEEAFAVKYYVQSYFKFYTIKGVKFKGTRTSEVDAIVIVPNKPLKVLYTLRFQANNDVDVERVGEVGTGASQFDPNKLDVARSPEYADKAQDPKKFAAWLKIRYPQVPVVGTTVEEMRSNVNTEAEAKAETPEWYKNYEIKVLDDADAKTRLKNAHKYKPEQLVDFKVFKPAELRVMEIALETMARKTLDVIKYTRLVRQRMSVSLQSDKKTWAEEPDVAGRAAQYGSSKTVLIFDSAFTGGDPTQFMGGTGGVVPEEADIYAHEFGHLVGSSSVQTKFDAFVKKNNIQPFTKYSKEKVAVGEPKEFFAEAFSQYQLDPEWMKTNHPLLHAWFETLAKTGVPPSK